MKFKIPKIPKIEMFGIDIIKNMMFFTLFIIIFLFLLGVIVAPSIKSFKEIKKEYFLTKFNLNNSEKNLNNKTYQYQKLFKENKRVIFAFRREFDKNNFKNFANKYMKITYIKENNSSIYENDFIKKTYIVSAILSTPQNFYEFVKASQNYKNIIKIYFPIAFKAKDNKIKLIYKLEHFKKR